MSEPPNLFDTHAHLHDPWIGDDLPEVMSRAGEAGVERIVTIGCSLDDSRNAIAVAEQYDNVWATVGLHPHDAKDWNADLEAEFRQLAAHERVVAIGEIGLDFFRNLSPHEDQYDAFEAQLNLADELNLPVVIHSRDAHEESYAVLFEWSKRQQRERPIGVIHCFSGDTHLARRYHKLGFLISFAGPITYPKNNALREAARTLPIEAIVIETDAPYLSPQPRRGKRNEPANIVHTAQQIAEVRGESLEVVARQTGVNTVGLFRF
jgi:TatD DNase family protein